MTDELDVDYVALKKGINTLYELYLKLNGEVEHIAEYTGNLDIFWDGDANSVYMERVSQGLIDIGAMLLRIRKSIRTLNTAFSIYMAGEKEVARIVGEFWKKINA